MLKKFRNQRKGHGSLPIDELLIVFLLLYFVFGYSVYDSLVITARVTYYSIAFIAAPIFLILFVYMSYSDEPVGGPVDEWWSPYAQNVKGQRAGVSYVNYSHSRDPTIRRR